MVNWLDSFHARTFCNCYRHGPNYTFERNMDNKVALGQAYLDVNAIS